MSGDGDKKSRRREAFLGLSSLGPTVGAPANAPRREPPGADFRQHSPYDARERQFNLKLNEYELKRLRYVAALSGRSQMHVVREALDKHLRDLLRSLEEEKAFD